VRSGQQRQGAETVGVRYRVNLRSNGREPLTAHQKQINRVRSKARAHCEHAFHVIKHLWGFTTVRYRGLAKNLLGCTQPLRWPTCICRDDGCRRCRQGVSRDRPKGRQRVATRAKHPSEGLDRGHFCEFETVAHLQLGSHGHLCRASTVGRFQELVNEFDC
jgi:hypothetical protein